MFKRSGDRVKNDPVASSPVEARVVQLIEDMEALFTQSPRQRDVMDKFMELCGSLNLDRELRIVAGKVLRFETLAVVEDGEPDAYLSVTFLRDDNVVDAYMFSSANEAFYQYAKSVDHENGNNIGHNVWVYSFDGDDADSDITFIMLDSSVLDRFLS